MAIVLGINEAYAGGAGLTGSGNPVINGDPCKSYIGYKNWISDASVTSSTMGDPSNAFDHRTNTFWLAGSGGETEFQLDQSRAVDYIALHSYDLRNAIITLDYHDGSEYLSLFSLDTLGEDDVGGDVVMAVFDAVTTDRLRIRIEYADDSDVQIGGILVGERLEIKGQTAGFNPIALSRANTITSTESHGAAPLGRQKVNFDQVEFDINVRLMESEQALGEWRLFIDHAEHLPFVFGYNAGAFGETAYVWAQDDSLSAPTFSNPIHLEQIINVTGSIGSKFTEGYNPGAAGSSVVPIYPGAEANCNLPTGPVIAHDDFIGDKGVSLVGKEAVVGGYWLHGPNYPTTVSPILTGSGGINDPNTGFFAEAHIEASVTNAMRYTVVFSFKGSGSSFQVWVEYDHTNHRGKFLDVAPGGVSKNIQTAQWTGSIGQRVNDVGGTGSLNLGSNFLVEETYTLDIVHSASLGMTEICVSGGVFNNTYRSVTWSDPQRDQSPLLIVGTLMREGDGQVDSYTARRVS